jgi:hypothetical protein
LHYIHAPLTFPYVFPLPTAKTPSEKNVLPSCFLIL